MRFVYTFVLLSGFAPSAIAQSTVILDQTAAPFDITEFSASYQEGGRYSSEGVRFDVSFSNGTDKAAVAYAIGFFAFDVFNRPLSRPLEGFSVTTIAPGEKGNGAWVQRMSSPALFKEYGTGVAYVARVRFGDGSIWNYDEENVLKQLQEFESSLTLEDLERD